MFDPLAHVPDAGSDLLPVPAELPQPDAALRNLATVLAHRLRGLVTSIEGFNDLLIDSLASHEQRDLALRIFESTVSIERILTDLKRYGRPVEPVPQRLPATHVVRETLNMLGDDLVDKLVIAQQIDGDVVLEVDAVLIQQALLVLLHNAAEATRGEGEIEFGSHAAGAGRVRFYVRNPGVIELDNAATAVFTPFYTTKAHNLGVGLSLARGIAEAHGGTVELVENSLETGIVFALELPVAAAG